MEVLVDAWCGVAKSRIGALCASAHNTRGKPALSTMCIGVGQGNALVIESA